MISGMRLPKNDENSVLKNDMLRTSMMALPRTSTARAASCSA